MDLDLSVVVATTDAVRSIDACLDAVAAACDGLRTECTVVDASRDGTADVVAARGEAVRLVTMPSGTLTPVLWAEGARRSTAPVIAFTTGHCLPQPGWARALLSWIGQGATGAGGPLALSPRAGVVDRAVFYLRYSAFLPHVLGRGRIEGELAGDNAAYRREALERHPELLADGFWEIDFHRAVRADGGWLAADPAALALFGPSFPLATIVAHRFAHGRQFGAARVARGGRSRWQVVAGMPLVPALFAWRAGRRIVEHDPRELPRFLASLPVFVALASAWAVGEAVGAITNAERGRRNAELKRSAELGMRK